MSTAPELGQTAPSWTQIIRDAIDAALAEMHAGLPAKVLNYDPGHQSVDVKPLLLRVAVDPDTELEQTHEIPVITNVPLELLSGGGWAISFPVAAGDIVYLAFAERSLDRWLEAPPGQLVDPLDSRHHDLSDAVARPGLRPRSSPIANLSPANMRIGREDGSVILDLSPTTVAITAPNVVINAGGDADQHLVRGEALLAYLEALAAAAQSAITIPSTGGIALPPGTIPTPPGSILSTNGRLK